MLASWKDFELSPIVIGRSEL
ncbi:hypothetical protein LINPERPRIM_LOCUS29447 [Linum perenne]